MSSIPKKLGWTETGPGVVDTEWWSQVHRRSILSSTIYKIPHNDFPWKFIYLLDSKIILNQVFHANNKVILFNLNQRIIITSIKIHLSTAPATYCFFSSFLKFHHNPLSLFYVIYFIIQNHKFLPSLNMQYFGLYITGVILSS